MADNHNQQQMKVESNVDKVKAKAKEVALEDFGKAKAIAFQAASSGSYLYPIKGIYYFLTHRELWTPFTSRILPTVGLALAVVIFMFTFTYVPQVALMFFTNGPLAPFTTILLILSESSTIVNMLSRNFIVQDALLDIFDGTLLARNEAGIVSNGRELKSGGSSISRLSKITRRPFEKFTLTALVRYFMYLPLNFIPIVGPAVFVFIQGRNRGKAAHARYFSLKGWNQKQTEQFTSDHVGPYTAFGCVATLIELVPVASILFSFTNTVGAALWAADIEKSEGDMTTTGHDVTTAPNLRQAAKKAQ